MQVWLKHAVSLGFNSTPLIEKTLILNVYILNWRRHSKCDGFLSLLETVRYNRKGEPQAQLETPNICLKKYYSDITNNFPYNKSNDKFNIRPIEYWIAEKYLRPAHTSSAPA